MLDKVLAKGRLKTAFLVFAVVLQTALAIAPAKGIADPPITEQAQVVIVGGGLSGLVALDRLQLLGIRNVVLLEATDRIGGRIWTARPNGNQPYFERAAELVNQSDTHLIALLNRYNIGLVERRFVQQDRSADYVFRERRLVNGQVVLGDFRVYTLEELNSLMNQIPADRSVLMRLMDLEQRRSSANAAIRLQAETYLRQTTAAELIGNGELTRAYMTALMQSEYGVSPDTTTGETLLNNFKLESNRLPTNQLFYTVSPLPQADESYRIQGGSDSIVRALQNAYPGRIRTGMIVNQVVETAPNAFTTNVTSLANQSLRWTSQAAVFAAPSSALQSMQVQLNEVNPAEIEHASRLPFANHSKIFLHFSEKFWDSPSNPGGMFSGEGMLESGVQFWDTSENQPGTEGVITLYLGALPQNPVTRAIEIQRILEELRNHPAFSQLDRYLTGVDSQVWTQSYAGVFTPSYPIPPNLFARNLSANFFFIGSDKDVIQSEEDATRAGQPAESLGYMEGAVRTGIRAANSIFARLQGLTTLSPCHSLLLDAG